MYGVFNPLSLSSHTNKHIWGNGGGGVEVVVVGVSAGGHFIICQP